ncbi:hypothetical protein KIPB_013212, partial [Kipferlia bialata]
LPLVVIGSIASLILAAFIAGGIAIIVIQRQRGEVKEKRE